MKDTLKTIVIPCLALLFLTPGLFAQSLKITAVVNAANFSPNLANGSIVSVFGSGLEGATLKLCSFQQANTCSVAQSLFNGPTQINAVLPFQSYFFGSKTAYLTVTSGAVITPYYSINLFEQAIGIFQQGWDCPYPATCALSPNKSAAATIQRGAVIDTSGSLITSQNPMNSKGIYSVYFNGGGFVPDGFARGAAVYSYLMIGRNGIIAFPFFSGHSPCCSGLDQLNFSLPGDILRGFSSDGTTVPSCSTFQFPLRLEMKLLIAGTSNDSPSDSVSVPVLINKGEFYCEGQ